MTTREAPLAHLVDDDAGHFPYKHDAVLAAVRDDAPAGPDGPDDDRVRAGDFMNEDVANASAEYVEAQAAYYTSGDADSLHAAQRLVDARRAHREGRPDGFALTATRAPRSNRG
jgi:hypothetical protein